MQYERSHMDSAKIKIESDDFRLTIENTPDGMVTLLETLDSQGATVDNLPISVDNRLVLDFTKKVDFFLKEIHHQATSN